MEFAFRTRELRSICEKEQEAISSLGYEVARRLQHRLADLDAAKDIYDLSSNVLEIIEERNLIIISLYDDCNLYLCANHPKNPINEDGNIIWAQVRRIKILNIGNHDDNY